MQSYVVYFEFDKYTTGAGYTRGVCTLDRDLGTLACSSLDRDAFLGCVSDGNPSLVIFPKGQQPGGTRGRVCREITLKAVPVGPGMDVE